MFAAVLAALVVTLPRFPGAAPLPSASGRFVLESEERDPDARARYHHALYVVERRSRERRLLVEYPRQVEAAWAPDRDAVAVTNHVGSTQSTLTLFVAEPGGTFRRLEVADALYAAFPTLRGELTSYLHVHLELRRWRRGGAVECTLRASAGGGPDFTHRYVVSLDGAARRT